MMHRTFIFILAVICFASCKPDTEIIVDDPNDIIAVISSCSANQTIKNIYLEDANRLAMRAILADNGSVWQDSIQISPEKVNDILGALLAVHNGTQMIYRDTVIAVYGIHSFASPILNQMLVKVDTTKAWVQQWMTGNQFTGNTAIDEMLNTFDLTWQAYNEWPLGNYVTLRSEQFLNINALAESFKTVDGVLDAQRDAEAGDGNDITYSHNTTTGIKELTYSAGYRDCETQCLKRRYWKFWVRDANCNLEYRGSWGDLAP